MTPPPDDVSAGRQNSCLDTLASFCTAADEKLTSDLGLNQVVPLCPDVFEEACDVDGVLVADLPQHAVQDDVGSCPAHAGAAEQ